MRTKRITPAKENGAGPVNLPIVLSQVAKATCEPGFFPTPRLCQQCNRLFFGQDCYTNHKLGSAKWKPLCETKKKCLSCRSIYQAACKEKKSGRPSNKYKHSCGWCHCPFCEKYDNHATHKCYIQTIDPKEDQLKLKKVKASDVGERAVLGVEKDGSCWVAKSSPLFVYADFEAVTADSGVQTPILVCCESEEEDETHSFYGTNCTEDFIDLSTVLPLTSMAMNDV